LISRVLFSEPRIPYCPKTCGLCTAGLSYPILASAQKATFISFSLIRSNTFHSNPSSRYFRCASWVRNGFCTSTFYSNAYKMQYCGRPCGLC
uniref:ShKT domain-containing protein n=1 Tax=Haemonchus placei TaxID=6290 RepID=A0A158QQ27_HAEPC